MKKRIPRKLKKKFLKIPSGKNHIRVLLSEVNGYVSTACIPVEMDLKGRNFSVLKSDYLKFFNQSLFK